MARVSIPISAEARQALHAFKQIQAEIRKTGQEGKKFAEIDFSKGGLKQYEQLLTRIKDNFQTLLTTSHRALGSRISATGQGRLTPWEMDFGRMYQNPSYARHLRQQFLSGILTGTEHQGAFSEQAASGGLGNALGGLAGIARFGRRNVVSPLLKMAGIGGIAAMASRSFSSAGRVMETTEELYRRTRESGMTKAWEFLRDQVTNTGRAFGLTNEQTASLALEFARTSAVVDRERVSRESLDAATFGLGAGMDPRTTVQGFGRAAYMGLTGPGGMGSREFALMLGDAISKGGMGARGEQVLEDLLHFTERLSEQTARAATPTDMEGFLALRTRMYQDGALRGPLGDTLIQRAQQALVSPGMGDAGEFFMMRALGSGAGWNPAKVRYLRESGLFANASAVGGAPGKTNLDLMMARIAQESRGLPDKFYGLEMGANLLGTTMPQFEKWQEIYQQMGAGGAGSLGRTLGRLGIKPEDVNVSGITEIGKILGARGGELTGIAERYRQRLDLTDADRKSLDEAKTTEDLRDTLIKIASHLNLEPTPWRDMQAQIADFEAKMETLGRELQKVVLDILTAVNKLADFFTELRSKFTNSYFGQMLGYEQTEWTGSAGMASQRPGARPGDYKPTGWLNDAGYSKYLSDLEQSRKLPRGYLGAIGQVEAGGDPNRVGSSGELGIFQFMQATGLKYGLVTDADRKNPYKSGQAAADLGAKSAEIYQRRIKNWGSLSSETQAMLLAAGHNANPDRIARLVGDTYEESDLETIKKSTISGTYYHMEKVRAAYEARRAKADQDRMKRSRSSVFKPDEQIPYPFELEQHRDLPPATTQPSAMNQMQSPIGQLEVTIRQQDGRGMPVGEDARHVMNLRTPRPFGRIDVEGVNNAGYGFA